MIVDANEKNAQKPIALFDSGLGGVTVLRALKRRFPNETFIYLGDSARTPYGTKSPETIQEYSLECARFLDEHDVKMLVIACNSASSHALGVLRENFPYPIIGTVTPAAMAASGLSQNGRIGVIGTEATVKSDAYRKAIRGFRPNAQVFSKSCPLFVPLVEQGITTGPMVEEACRMYLSALRSLRTDVLVLGCTHYPLLDQAIQSFMGSEVNVIDCAEAVAEEVEQTLGSRHLLAKERRGEDLFYVTDGEIRFRFLASRLLDAQPIEVLHIQSLDSGSKDVHKLAV